MVESVESKLVLGFWRAAKYDLKEVEAAVKMCLDYGVNIFDNAATYFDGESERKLGDIFRKNPGIREKVHLQTKCGIVRDDILYYDFSKKNILQSVDQSLERLGTKYIDTLLLHRPDVLMDPAEVGKTIDELYTSGRVRQFGVSNMNGTQISLIQKYTKHKIMCNQLQISPVQARVFSQGLFVNTDNENGVYHHDDILEYCYLNDIIVQAWSVFLASRDEGTYIDNPNYERLNQFLDDLCSKYNVGKNAIIIAWLLKHPSSIKPVFGTYNLEYIKDILKGPSINLTHKEWYKILVYGIGSKLP